ncbi:MAG: hypothetical protein PWP46_1198 [Fusobacteriaceae bacterium]|jgi:hypothetical protein|nr:hypothetical protein [Fusobacteriaceae bacterium]
MKKNTIKEIAFFNILKTLIPPTSKFTNYKLNYTDLADKIDMDKQIIRSAILNLANDHFIDVLNDTSDEIDINFNRTYEKLLEVFSIEDIDPLLEKMQEFLQVHPNYFNIFESDDSINLYAKQVKERIGKYGIDANINDIIENGVKYYFSKKENLIAIKKSIFNICEKAETEDDLEALEAILFYQLNFPIEQNPFYVTLFLSKIYIQMGKL